MNVGKSATGLAMTDAAIGADLIRQVAGPRGSDERVKNLLDRAYRALARANPKWTRRRVRALWNREVARVEHQEIAEMQAILALRRARKDHAEFKAETDRLAAAFAVQDEDFYRDQIEALRGILGGMGLPGNRGGPVK